MAYTSAPEVQTYSSQRVPLVWDFQVNNVASNTIVAGLINLLPFKLNEEEFAETRAAIRGTTILASGAVVRGMHVWEKVPGTTVYYFVVINTSVYTSTDATTWTAVDTLLTNVTTPVRFTEYIDDTNTKKLILVDGVEGYIYTSNAAGTKITDADFPTPHVPFPIFLDGYLFLAKANTGDIYNSDLNDPSSWTAGSFISSEVYPDDIQALIKINNYILAVGVHGSEFFYDAANTTASPLARYEGGLLPFGTNMPNSIASNNSLAMFLGNSRDGELSFFTISGLQFQPVPAISVIRSFIQNDSSRFSNAKMRAFLFRQNGELHYALNGNGDTTGTNTCYCTAYSFSQKKWCLFRGTGTSSSSYPVYFSNPGISEIGRASCRERV